jgi:hypothetical protein
MEVEGSHLLVGHFLLECIYPIVQRRVHLQSCSGLGCSDEIDDDLVTFEHLASPIHADKGEELVLDLIPLAGARRIVAHRHLKSRGIGEPLQFLFPEAETVAVGPPAIGGDEQPLRIRVAFVAECFPPSLDRRHRELARIVVEADVDVAAGRSEVEDSIGHRLAQLLVGKIVYADLDRFALRKPLSPVILEVPDQFLLFRVDRDHRVSGLEELFGPLIDVPELLVPVGMTCSFLGLALGLQAIAGFIQ